MKLKSCQPPLLTRGVGKILLFVVLLLSLGAGFQSTLAQQRISASDAWRLVYKQLPDFPLENQYTSKETGKVSENSTLLSRMIQYHLYQKGRAPNFRLDWKLTLADYLDINEIIDERTYPGNDTLRKNPRDGDKAAIARLNRNQRDALVQALVNVFSGTTENSSQSTEGTPTRSPQPQPGDAQLLK